MKGLKYHFISFSKNACFTTSMFMYAELYPNLNRFVPNFKHIVHEFEGIRGEKRHP